MQDRVIFQRQLDLLSSSIVGHDRRFFRMKSGRKGSRDTQKVDATTAKIEVMKTYFVWLSLLISCRALACDPGCDPHQSQFAFKNLVQQIAIIGKKDNRETYPAYARRTGFDTSNLSGTVRLVCGREGGAANLVSSNGCFAVDSHAFMIRDSKRKCQRFMTDEEIRISCYFQTVDPNGRILPERHLLNHESLKLPETDNCNEPDTFGNDWAVIQARFDVPARLSKPYPIFDTSAFGSVEDNFANVGYKNPWKVTVVSMPSNNYVDPSAPTICDGVMGVVQTEKDSQGKTEVFHTTSCSSGPGNSGGAVTIHRGKNEVPAILGVATWSKNRDKDGVEYGNENYTAGTVIRGEFLKAINDCKKTKALNR